MSISRSLAVIKPHVPSIRFKAGGRLQVKQGMEKTAIQLGMVTPGMLCGGVTYKFALLSQARTVWSGGSCLTGLGGCCWMWWSVMRLTVGVGGRFGTKIEAAEMANFTTYLRR